MSTPWHGYEVAPPPQSVLDEIEQSADRVRAAKGFEKHLLLEELTELFVYDNRSFGVVTHAGVKTMTRVCIHDLSMAIAWATERGFRVPRDRRKLHAKLTRFLKPFLRDSNPAVPGEVASLQAGVHVSPKPEAAVK